VTPLRLSISSWKIGRSLSCCSLVSLSLGINAVTRCWAVFWTLATGLGLTGLLVVVVDAVAGGLLVVLPPPAKAVAAMLTTSQAVARSNCKFFIFMFRYFCFFFESFRSQRT